MNGIIIWIYNNILCSVRSNIMSNKTDNVSVKFSTLKKKLFWFTESGHNLRNFVENLLFKIEKFG